jgi:CubicO group peptidase (beta-lactamase class C family)
MVGFKAWVLLVSGMAGLLALFLFGPLLFLAENIYAATPVWPGSAWQEQKPSQLGMDEADLNKARDYALQKGGGSGMIIGNGYIVMKWGDQGKRYDIKSSTKSIGVTILGLALKDEKINLSDQAQKRLSTVGVPPDSNKNTGWLDAITILHLATQTAGFEKTGGLGEILFEPGEEWSYSDGGPNWLADVLTVTYGEDLGILLCDRVLEPIGVDCLDDIHWRSNIYRSKDINGIPRREFGSGIDANVDAMARVGYLYLRKGLWGETRILPEEFVEMARQPLPEVQGLSIHSAGNEIFPDAPQHYGLLWWNNADGTLPNVPTDAYWSWGLYESFIVVIPSLDIVAVRAGDAWRSSDGQDPYEVLEPFLQHIAASVQ